MEYERRETIKMVSAAAHQESKKMIALPNTKRLLGHTKVTGQQKARLVSFRKAHNQMLNFKCLHKCLAEPGPKY